jgi:hypothetical protein
VVEPCNRRQRAPVGRNGETELLCCAMACPFPRLNSHPKTCTLRFHTSRRLLIQNVAMTSLWCMNDGMLDTGQHHVWKQRANLFMPWPGRVVCAITNCHCSGRLDHGPGIHLLTLGVSLILMLIGRDLGFAGGRVWDGRRGRDLA